MLVKSFSINNLRNVKIAQFNPIPGLNCFVGPNGSGKTSLLEALVLLSKGRSFRSGQISSIIGNKNNKLQIIATIKSDSKDSHQLGMERGVEHWNARHNGEAVTQLSELTQLLPYVLLEPSSHRLVSGPPEGRRKYLDWGVFHVKQGFLTLWRRYNRTLKQRNAALRQSAADVVESLDLPLASLGEELHGAREQYAACLTGKLQGRLEQLDKNLGGIGMRYRKGWSGESLLEAVQQSVKRDTERGTTGSGPHKAELYFSLDGTAAKEKLSRGEQKVLTAALLMAQAQLICESGEKPVLLLDDLASELDRKHLEKVLGAGLDLGVQIWLTGTVLPQAVELCGADFKLFHVKHGKVS